jgi:hypothetical protein
MPDKINICLEGIFILIDMSSGYEEVSSVLYSTPGILLKV